MMQGMGGLMSITGRSEGEPGSGPQKVGVAMIDLSTGLYAAIAILAALVQRARTGRGQYIDLALLDVSVAMLAYQGMSFLATGLAPKAPGNAHPSIVPYQDFPTRDGHFMLAIGNDRQFAEFCRCAGHPEWSADARYATNPQRVAHRGELVPMLAEATRTRSTARVDRVTRATGRALRADQQRRGSIRRPAGGRAWAAHRYPVGRRLDGARASPVRCGSRRRRRNTGCRRPPWARTPARCSKDARPRCRRASASSARAA